MNEETRMARQWVAKAKNDLLNADNNLAAEAVPCDTVCFHCQQAAEKLLKAYLARRGISAPRVHDLLAILQRVLLQDESAEELRDPLSDLNPYAVEIRYPDEGFMPSRQDAREAREAAGHVWRWLEASCPEVVSGPRGT